MDFKKGWVDPLVSSSTTRETISVYCLGVTRVTRPEPKLNFLLPFLAYIGRWGRPLSPPRGQVNMWQACLLYTRVLPIPSPSYDLLVSHFLYCLLIAGCRETGANPRQLFGLPWTWCHGANPNWKPTTLTTQYVAGNPICHKLQENHNNHRPPETPQFQTAFDRLNTDTPSKAPCYPTDTVFQATHTGPERNKQCWYLPLVTILGSSAQKTEHIHPKRLQASGTYTSSMKCLEKLVLTNINHMVPDAINPLQFA